jgi:2-iminobutanoate/2-iminopropanoate deaminase
MNLRPLIGICCALAAAVIGYLVLAERREGPDDQATIAADTVIYHTPFGAPTRPFSPAVQVGNVIFLSGQIGTDASASGGVVPGGIEAETRQTLENIKDVLQRSGSSMDRVVKCTVMMADMREWDRMNVVYATYFPKNKPARSALGANGLALGARVEIECWATVG